jgi:hypothetical protein
MKKILHFLAKIALLPVSGCIFPRNRDYLDDRNCSEAHPQVSEVKERGGRDVRSGEEKFERSASGH